MDGTTAEQGRPRPALATRSSLADSVHTSLLAWLMDGHVGPGASLSIEGLARDLGVSPTPVREALARIESTGLVERAALKGYRVASILTAAEVRSLVDARLHLECRNARCAAGLVDGPTLDRLARCLEVMQRAPKGPSFEQYREYHAADNEFHSIINAAGGNPFLAAAFEQLNGQIQRSRLRTVPGHGITDAEVTSAEHSALLEALRAHDADRAEATMRHHLEGVLERVLHERAAAGSPSSEPVPPAVAEDLTVAEDPAVAEDLAAASGQA